MRFFRRHKICIHLGVAKVFLLYLASPWGMPDSWRLLGGCRTPGVSLGDARLLVSTWGMPDSWHLLGRRQTPGISLGDARLLASTRGTPDTWRLLGGCQTPGIYLGDARILMSAEDSVIDIVIPDVIVSYLFLTLMQHLQERWSTLCIKFSLVPCTYPRRIYSGNESPWRTKEERKSSVCWLGCSQRN